MPYAVPAVERERGSEKELGAVLGPFWERLGEFDYLGAVKRHAKRGHDEITERESVEHCIEGWVCGIAGNRGDPQTLRALPVMRLAMLATQVS